MRQINRNEDNILKLLMNPSATGTGFHQDETVPNQTERETEIPQSIQLPTQIDIEEPTNGKEHNSDSTSILTTEDQIKADGAINMQV